MHSTLASISESIEPRASVTLRSSMGRKPKERGERFSFALNDGSYLLLEELEDDQD